MTPELYFTMMNKLHSLYPGKALMVSEVMRYNWRNDEYFFEYELYVENTHCQVFKSVKAIQSFLDEISRQSTVVVGEKKPRWNS